MMAKKKKASHEDSHKLVDIGEKTLKACLIKQTKKPTVAEIKKREDLKKKEESASAQELVKSVPQKIVDILLPVLHLLRTEIADQVLLDSAIQNFDVKSHGLLTEYIKNIVVIQDSVDSIKTKLDVRLDEFVKNDVDHKKHMISCLEKLHANQLEIVASLGSIGPVVLTNNNPLLSPSTIPTHQTNRPPNPEGPPQGPPPFTTHLTQPSPPTGPGQHHYLDQLLSESPLPNLSSTLIPDARPGRLNNKGTDGQPKKKEKNSKNIPGSHSYSKLANERSLEHQNQNQNRFSIFDYEEVGNENEEDPPTTPFITGDPENPVGHKPDPWIINETQRRSREIFNGLTRTGKRKYLKDLREEEDREKRSVLLFGIPHSGEGLDYKRTEISKALEIFTEISTFHLKAHGCDIIPTDIKRGHRMWMWKGKEEFKPIKIEFHTLEKSTKAKSAIRVAGFLGKRNLTKLGLYKLTGNKKENKAARKCLPKTFVNESTTKAQRQTIKEQKNYKSSEIFKDKQNYQEFMKDNSLNFSMFYNLPDPEDMNSDPNEHMPTTQNGDYRPWQYQGPPTQRRPLRRTAARTARAALEARGAVASLIVVNSELRASALPFSYHQPVADTSTKRPLPVVAQPVGYHGTASDVAKARAGPAGTNTHTQEQAQTKTAAMSPSASPPPPPPPPPPRHPPPPTGRGYDSGVDPAMDFIKDRTKEVKENTKLQVEYLEERMNDGPLLQAPSPSTKPGTVLKKGSLATTVVGNNGKIILKKPSNNFGKKVKIQDPKVQKNPGKKQGKKDKAQATCKFSTLSKCETGIKCRFKHEPETPRHQPSDLPHHHASVHCKLGNCGQGQDCPHFYIDSSLLQPRSETKPCRFFAEGRCEQGKGCRYSHARAATPEEIEDAARKKLDFRSKILSSINTRSDSDDESGSSGTRTPTDSVAADGTSPQHFETSKDTCPPSPNQLSNGDKQEVIQVVNQVTDQEIETDMEISLEMDQETDPDGDLDFGRGVDLDIDQEIDQGMDQTVDHEPDQDSRNHENNNGDVIEEIPGIKKFFNGLIENELAKGITSFDLNLNGNDFLCTPELKPRSQTNTSATSQGTRSKSRSRIALALDTLSQQDSSTPAAKGNYATLSRNSSCPPPNPTEPHHDSTPFKSQS